MPIALNHALEPTPRRTSVLTPRDLEVAIARARARNVSLLDLLLVEERLPETAVAAAFSRWLDIPMVRLAAMIIDGEAVRAISGRLARQHTCLPIRFTGKSLVLALANPVDGNAVRDVEFASGHKVATVVACRSEIESGIDAHYDADPAPAEAVSEADVFTGRSVAGDALDVDPERSEPLPDPSGAPVVRLCSQIVADAIALRASDIHIEPGPREMRVRLRIDGLLRDHLQLPGWMCTALVSRVKVLARMDIAKQRVPQDGRINARLADREIEMRVSTLPTHFGEKVVMRLLGSTLGTPTLDALGLSSEQRALLDDAVRQPQGLILVTGPTGAGKSTTLYSLLTSRPADEVNVITIEDPIEYQVPGASQVQVDARAGLTFAGCLRAVLRQDPDLILVGEMRDHETAEVGFQAALTGHLVFSTLHTNGTVPAIERLIDLGIKPLLVTSATNLIVAQRLARRVCESCRERYVPSPDVLRRLRIRADRQEFAHGRGCPACGQTGYAGRVGIFEILRLTPRVRDLIHRRAPESELRDAARRAGMRLLIEDALAKVREGLTTVDEVARVIGIDHAEGSAPRQPKLVA